MPDEMNLMHAPLMKSMDVICFLKGSNHHFTTKNETPSKTDFDFSKNKKKKYRITFISWSVFSLMIGQTKMGGSCGFLFCRYIQSWAPMNND